MRFANRWRSLILACSFALPQWVDAGDWPRFRGPNGTGVAEGGAPTEFGENKNIKWKYALPGRGVSSPIVVGDKVFVTCYSGYGMGRGDAGAMEDLTRHLVCLDRHSGEKLWVKDVPAKMPEDPYSGAGVPSHGYASHTPVSDGERVYAFFGKSGVYAFDMNGKELWNQGVGTESGRQRWGSAASPIVFGDYVIVNASDESEAIVWLDKETGEEKTRKEASGLSNSWSTPALITHGDTAEVVINVPGEIWAFDAVSGSFRWYATGPSDNAQNSVLVNDGIVYAMGGRGGEAVAIRGGGMDDASSELIWNGRAQGRYATPVIHDGHVFMFDGNVAMCLNAETGERVYQTRLTSGESVADAGGGGRGGRGGGRGGFGGGGGRRGFGGGRNGDYASPVVADGKIYVTLGSGTVYVLAAKPEFELLATNDMSFDSSGFGGTPAISDGQLFLRSNTHLYCIAED